MASIANIPKDKLRTILSDPALDSVEKCIDAVKPLFPNNGIPYVRQAIRRFVEDICNSGLETDIQFYNGDRFVDLSELFQDELVDEAEQDVAEATTDALDDIRTESIKFQREVDAYKALRGDEERPLDLKLLTPAQVKQLTKARSEKPIAEHMGWTVKDLKAFIQQPAIQDYWNYYLRYYDQPMRERVENGELKPDGTPYKLAGYAEPFEEVRAHMKYCESDGKRTLSLQQLDTAPPSDWTGITHAAMFLYWTHLKTAELRAGALYNTGWSEEAALQILYVILRLLRYKASPSRSKKGTNKQGTTRTKAARRAKVGDQTVNSSTNPPNGNQDDDGDEVMLDPDEEEDEEEEITESMLPGKRPLENADDVVEEPETEVQVQTYLQALKERGVLHAIASKKDVGVFDIQNPYWLFWFIRFLTCALDLAKHRTTIMSSPFQLLERAAVEISKFAESNAAAEKKLFFHGEVISVFVRDKWNVVLKALQKLEADSALLPELDQGTEPADNEARLRDLEEASIEEAIETAQMTDPRPTGYRIDWKTKSKRPTPSANDDIDITDETIDLINVPALTDNDHQQAKWLNRLFKTKPYTIADFERAFRNLHLVRENRGYRLRGMSNAIQFHWWQPLGTSELVGMVNKGRSGAFLGDRVGLGKTITAAALVFHEFLRAIGLLGKKWTELRPVRGPRNNILKFKPALILMPIHLVVQWVEVLLKMSTHFDITFYHNDGAILNSSHEIKRSTRVKRTGRWLDAKSSYLEPSARHCKIIITTPETFASRHCLGDAEIEAYNAKRRARNEHGGNLKKGVKPDNFTQDLEDVFSMVVIDEAHICRNPENIFNIAVRWLVAPFTLYVTATPLFNSHYDILGALTLIQSRRSKETFSRGNGTFRRGQNPFDEDSKDHIEARLCVGAAKKFITDLKPDSLSEEDKKVLPVIQGARLHSIFEAMMVGRGYDTVIVDEKKEIIRNVGDQMPRPDPRKLIAPKTRSSRSLVDDNDLWARRHQNHILEESIGGGAKKKTVVVNAAASRMLCLTTLLPWLCYVEPMMEPAIWLEGFKANAIPPEHKYYTLVQSMQRRLRGVDFLAQLVNAAYDGAKEAHAYASVLLRDHRNPTAADPVEGETAQARLARLAKLEQIGDDIERQHLKEELFGLGKYRREALECHLNAYKHVPAPYDGENPMSLFTTFLDTSPKLQVLFRFLGDLVLLKGRKVIIWVSYPTEQDILLSLMQLVGIKADLLSSDIKPSERGTKASMFNKLFDPKEEFACQVLICSYKVSPCGLNLQEQCSDVVLLDPGDTEANVIQVIGRTLRLNCIRPVVTILRIVLADSNDGRVLDKAKKNAGSITVANMQDPGDLYGYYWDTEAKVMCHEWMPDERSLPRDWKQRVRDGTLVSLAATTVLNDALEGTRGREDTLGNPIDAIPTPKTAKRRKKATPRAPRIKKTKSKATRTEATPADSTAPPATPVTSSAPPVTPAENEEDPPTSILASSDAEIEATPVPTKHARTRKHRKAPVSAETIDSEDDA